MTLTETKLYFCIGESFTARTRGVCVCVCLPSLSNEQINQTKTKRFKKKKKKDTFRRQPSIYTLRQLACHSISHSVDYTQRRARPENHAGNPILCHIKCQGRSFRCCVITTETAGGDAEGGEGGWRKGETEG